MPTPTSHGSTCSWNGTPLGTVTRFRADPGTAVIVEKTNVTSEVVGVGADARVVKTYDCVAIDPGTLEVTLFGCPPYTTSDIGGRGSAVFTWSGGGITRPAFLERFEVVGAVGQFLVGQAVFRLTGEAS